MNKKSINFMLLAIGILISLQVEARCTRKNFATAGADISGLGTALGNVNITSDYLQPVGSSLGASVINWTQAPVFTNPDTVLYECDLTDKDDIYEMFATNGDDRVGGYWDIGKIDGYPNYFATWFPYAAIKLTHLNSGQEFTRFWQQYPITSYGVDGNKLQIRVKDLSSIRTDLIKVSTLPPRTGSGSNFCSGMGPVTGNSTYNCNQPNGYIIIKSPTPGYIWPPVGSDSNNNFQGAAYNFWMSIGLNGSPRSTSSHAATCVVRNVTPLVILPSISASQLNAGQMVSSIFDISVECDKAAISGVVRNQVSMGLQTTIEAFQTAQRLGLVNPQGGVSHLLSEGYGTNPAIATGVGIKLSNTSTGQSMPFVGWNGCTAASPCTTATANQAGWFPVLSGASSANSPIDGYTNYTTQMTATLTRLPNQQAQAGLVDAKAYVLIKVQ